MDREELSALLSACNHLKAKKDVYTCAESANVDLLLKAGESGPAPIARVKTLSLMNSFLQIETETNSYLLPYSVVFGLKWAEKETRTSRTGFHA